MALNVSYLRIINLVSASRRLQLGLKFNKCNSIAPYEFRRSVDFEKYKINVINLDKSKKQAEFLSICSEYHISLTSCCWTDFRKLMKCKKSFETDVIQPFIELLCKHVLEEND